jgi:hypothetical protein|tara:strand:+ start:689 stop:802 length:114 start_codon:yes stop_codon:yes gene_type:complete
VLDYKADAKESSENFNGFGFADSKTDNEGTPLLGFIS